MKYTDTYFWFVASCYWRLSKKAEELRSRVIFRQWLVCEILLKREMDRAYLNDVVDRIYIKGAHFHSVWNVTEGA